MPGAPLSKQRQQRAGWQHAHSDLRPRAEPASSMALRPQLLLETRCHWWSRRLPWAPTGPVRRQQQQLQLHRRGPSLRLLSLKLQQSRRGRSLRPACLPDPRALRLCHPRRGCSAMQVPANSSLAMTPCTEESCSNISVDVSCIPFVSVILRRAECMPGGHIHGLTAVHNMCNCRRNPLHSAVAAHSAGAAAAAGGAGGQRGAAAAGLRRKHCLLPGRHPLGHGHVCLRRCACSPCPFNMQCCGQHLKCSPPIPALHPFAPIAAMQHAVKAWASCHL